MLKYFNLTVAIYNAQENSTQEESFTIINENRIDVSNEILRILRDEIAGYDEFLSETYTSRDPESLLLNSLDAFRNKLCDGFNLETSILFDEDADLSIAKVVLEHVEPEERKLMIDVTPEEYEVLMTVRKHYTAMPY